MYDCVLNFWSENLDFDLCWQPGPRPEERLQPTNDRPANLGVRKWKNATGQWTHPPIKRAIDRVKDEMIQRSYCKYCRSFSVRGSDTRFRGATGGGNSKNKNLIQL